MKERMLTVLVPIKDSDATVVSTLPAIDPDNINVIYKHDGIYKRIWLNPTTNQYEYHEVVDREFPYLGKPLEVFDFTYDATRMGTAPTISAQGIMWYADKDTDGNDVTLEGLWSQECHVTFNGENFYLKQIPTSSKSNEDARYKYDIDFVSERVVLEQVYMYDVVQPFITERPISESASFSFYGDVSELAKRINASLLKSNLSYLSYRENISWILLDVMPSDWGSNWRSYFEYNGFEYVSLAEIYTQQSHAFRSDAFYKFGHPRLLSDEETLAAEDQYFTYSEWCAIKLGTYDGPLSTRDVYLGVTEPDTSVKHHVTIFDHYNGDYNAYLRNEVFLIGEDGGAVLNGYVCKIGKDKKGELTTSEEKLITFENNTIHEALQQVHDTFELQYYITKERNANGDFTGNTLIMIADCEHDFADVDVDDYVRDTDGIPTTEHPFDYGVEGALLSKEKTNTTEKIITRITGTGSEENIPWYYPNPTADGWIKPVYKTNGEIQEIEIDYPTSEGSTVPENVRYEKYLKNRIGDVFQYGRKTATLSSMDFVEGYGEHTTHVDEVDACVCYDFTINEPSRLKITPFTCSFAGANVQCIIYDEHGSVMSDNIRYAFLNGGTITLDAGTYHLVFEITFSSGGPSAITSIDRYFYPSKNISCGFFDTWSWRFLIPALSAIGTFAVIYSLLSDTFGNGFDSSLPGFFSNNPNLKFRASSDASKMGWYDGNRRISTSEMEFGEINTDYYAFLGGEGPKQVGEDDIYKVSFTTKKVGSYNLQLLGYNWNNAYDVYCFVMDMVNGYRAYRNSPISEEEVDVDVDSFVMNYIGFSTGFYIADGWYKNSKKVNLADFGITEDGEWTPDVFDTIEFQRLKYVTPQPTLMPELYIKTDGERRFYNAINYPLANGTPDAMIGEEESGGQIINQLYYKEDTTTHYDFENEYVKNIPKEHIEAFDDVKPTIKGHINTVDGQSFRIDVVEEFGYDEFDNDEIWESNEDGNVSGEYKHPYFFAKLRPLGFNLFDLALQDDMVLSMTTGHCGACNFKIGVDENTKKNPVQIWEYDVYGGPTYADKGDLLYAAGTLRRYVDTSTLYYDTDGTQDGYILVDTGIASRVGFLVNANRSYVFQRAVYSAEKITLGEVGSLKQDGKTHSVGDVVTNGRFIDSQQDTSENYVWVALMKDTDTYGVLMPSARPDYGDGNYSVYIRPKSVADVHTEESTASEDEENADKFVLVNIRMPQVYLREAERELSRKLVAHMYDNNYQKFNFSIDFSRIFLADNQETENDLNENNVLYVSFDNKTYRQYVKHYTYRMSHDVVLPEIKVDMNEELSVSRTQTERQNNMLSRNSALTERRLRRELASTADRISRKTVGKNEDAVISGNLVSRDAVTSFVELNAAAQDGAATQIKVEENQQTFRSFVDASNTFNADVADRLKRIRLTIENRVQPYIGATKVDGGCQTYRYDYNQITGTASLLWLNSDGSEIIYDTTTTCPANEGMGDVSWLEFSVS